MNGNRRRVSRSSALFVGLTLVAGCSDDGFGRQRYSVQGTVTYKGENLAKGQISFVPDAQGGQAASGQIENGYYSLSTLTPGDGALPGKYKVTVVAKDVDRRKSGLRPGTKVCRQAQPCHSLSSPRPTRRQKARYRPGTISQPRPT